ncbi:MAG: aldo/keto reductase [Marinilabiliales bacterium]|nr:aldo/keto reductase [Marinilabiliales bacterium]
MDTNNRRNFLKKGLLGATGAALLPATLQAAERMDSKIKAPELPGRMLGKSGIKLPLISMGTGGTTNPEFVKAAYDMGIKLFFSATYYGNGNNEILVGEGLKGIPRENFLLGTAAIPKEIDKRSGLLNSDFTADKYRKVAEDSLKRFGMDHIDVMVLPFAAKKETVQHEAVLKTMEALKKEGKIRFAGIASHGDTVEALNAAAETGAYDFAMISYNYKVQNREMLDAAIALAANKGMGIVAMKTTAGVYREKSGPQMESNALLKWALQNEHITSIVSGMRSIEELQKNLAMIRNLALTEEEKKQLALLGVPASTGLYCQQCKSCVPQCPGGLDIPTYMRSYMYAHGYHNYEQAWHTLAETVPSTEVCSQCSSCRVDCISGFDVKAKIADIERLRQVPLDFMQA